MTTTMETNGKLRKSLADQIDRLDAILDGLANALNESVAAAVKEAVGLAVREAVQAVFSEVLTNPAVLAAVVVNPAAAPPSQQPAARPPLMSRLCRWAGRVAGRVGEQVRATAAVCLRGAALVPQGLAACWAPLRHFRLQVLTALGVGGVAAVAVYHAGPWLASVAGGLGSFAAALAVQLLVRIRRLLAGPFFGGV
jgi:hypothetical protein